MTNAPAASPRGLLPALVVACFGLRCILAFRPFGILDDGSLSDDSYIAFLLARNIAKGLGPYYTTGFTNGFQPLQVFMLAPLYRFLTESTFAPIRGSLLISAVFDSASAVVLYRWISSFSRSAWIAPLITFVWMINPYVLQVSQNGLETSIAFFFILLSLAYSWRLLSVEPAPGSWKRFAILGLILGGAMLARIDSIFLFPVILAQILWRLRRPGQRKDLLTGAAALVIASLLLYAPWIAYSLYYTGSIFQVSGGATRYVALGHAGYHPAFPGWYLYTYSVATNEIWEHQWVIACHVAALALVSLGLAGNRLKGHAQRVLKIVTPTLLFSAILFCAYAFYMFAFWYYARYLYPLTLLTFLLLAVFADTFLALLENPRTKMISGWILALTLFAASVSSAQFQELFTHEDKNGNGYMDVGLWARKHFPDGTRIGSSQTGALAYFAGNLRVYNLDGVVNSECYRWLLRKQNMEYIRNEKIEYVLGWRSNIAFLRLNSTGWSENDLSYVGTVPGIRSWGQQWLIYKVGAEQADASSFTP